MKAAIDLVAVADIIEAAAREVILPRWRRLAAHEVEQKSSPGDLVTVADREAEALLAQRLTELLPGSVIVGEEGVHADPSRMGLFQGTAPVWVIDPIDGTAAFAAGETHFTVMVALVVDGEVRAGWIHAPAHRETHFGGPGLGASLRTERLTRSVNPPVIGRGTALTGIVGRSALALERQEALLRSQPMIGRLIPALYAGREYPRLIEGSAHLALFNRSEPWDHLPGVAIVRGLGFEAVKRDGSRYLPGDNAGGLLVAPAILIEEVRALLLAA